MKSVLTLKKRIDLLEEIVKTYDELDEVLRIMPDNIDAVIEKQTKHFKVRQKLNELKQKLVS